MDSDPIDWSEYLIEDPLPDSLGLSTTTESSLLSSKDQPAVGTAAIAESALSTEASHTVKATSAQPQAPTASTDVHPSIGSPLLQHVYNNPAVLNGSVLNAIVAPIGSGWSCELAGLGLHRDPAPCLPPRVFFNQPTTLTFGGSADDILGVGNDVVGSINAQAVDLMAKTDPGIFLASFETDVGALASRSVAENTPAINTAGDLSGSVAPNTASQNTGSRANGSALSPPGPAGYTEKSRSTVTNDQASRNAPYLAAGTSHNSGYVGDGAVHSGPGFTGGESSVLAILASDNASNASLSAVTNGVDSGGSSSSCVANTSQPSVGASNTRRHQGGHIVNGARQHGGNSIFDHLSGSLRPDGAVNYTSNMPGNRSTNSQLGLPAPGPVDDTVLPATVRDAVNGAPGFDAGSAGVGNSHHSPARASLIDNNSGLPGVSSVNNGSGFHDSPSGVGNTRSVPPRLISPVGDMPELPGVGPAADDAPCFHSGPAGDKNTPDVPAVAGPAKNNLRPVDDVPQRTPFRRSILSAPAAAIPVNVASPSGVLAHPSETGSITFTTVHRIQDQVPMQPDMHVPTPIQVPDERTLANFGDLVANDIPADERVRRLQAMELIVKQDVPEEQQVHDEDYEDFLTGQKRKGHPGDQDDEMGAKRSRWKAPELPIPPPVKFQPFQRVKNVILTPEERDRREKFNNRLARLKKEHAKERNNHAAWRGRQRRKMLCNMLKDECVNAEAERTFWKLRAVGLGALADEYRNCPDATRRTLLEAYMDQDMKDRRAQEDAQRAAGTHPLQQPAQHLGLQQLAVSQASPPEVDSLFMEQDSPFIEQQSPTKDEDSESLMEDKLVLPDLELPEESLSYLLELPAE